MFTRFVPDSKFVYTIHHVHEQPLSASVPVLPASGLRHHQRISAPARDHAAHADHPSRHRSQLPIELQSQKQEYLSFLGRIAPIKGTHLAIEVAKKSGIPLKIAGEVQPIFQDYFDTQIKPHIDGKFIEYVGEADITGKNELLGNSLAMLFPIQWDEPFGLVMIEAMACGTPVLALPGGAVEEVVCDESFRFSVPVGGRDGTKGERVAGNVQRSQRASILPAIFLGRKHGRGLCCLVPEDGRREQSAAKIQRARSRW